MHRQAGEHGRQRVAMLPNTVTQPHTVTRNVSPIGPIARTGPIGSKKVTGRKKVTGSKKVIGHTRVTGSTRSPLTLAILIFLALGLAACHKTPAPTTAASTVTVVISPTSTSLNVGTRTTFTAAASGGSLNTVTWQVNGTTGGNSSVGTIDSSGTYTAPASVPSGNTVTVTAVSTDVTTVTASSTVTILPPATVTINPAQASLTAGAIQPFTATVQGAPTSTVSWQVNAQPGGTQAFGFITATGVYTAPPSPPPGGTASVTAIAQSDPSQSASATVSLSFGSASLRGSYAFSLTGKNAAGPFARAGSFWADGTGGLRGGLEDVRDSSGVRQNVSFTGTYSVGADGRGTLSFNDSLTPSSFRIVLASNSQMQIIGFDAAGSAQGAASLSDPSTFQLSAFSGVYVFDFAGAGAASKAFSEIGELSFNGSGSVSGLEDRNDNGTLSSKVPLTGTYTVSANGRGTAQLVGGGLTANFTFYIVSRGSAKFVEVDASPAPIVAGPAVQQTPNATFNQGSLNGRYAFLLSGASPSGTIATAGSFSAAGAGTLTNGSLDENNNGSVLNAQQFTGSYLIDSTGRGTASFQAPNRTYSIVFYLAAQGGAVFQETDSSITSDGVSAAQNATFTQSAFAGSYAAGWNGTASAAAQQIAAQLSINSTGNVTGSLDLSTVPGSQISAQALNGTLAVAANGRGTLQLNPAGDNRNFAVYAVTPSLLFTVGTDSGRVAAGSVFRQF